MIRQTLTPRANWQAKVEALGLIWHEGRERPYWDESACYRFTRAQIDTIEAATSELYRLFLAAGEAVVSDPALLNRFAIPPVFHDPIREAWEAEPPALNFGRFDLGYDGSGAPKLFEFNCDTPTSLLEAAVVQWAWKEECFPALDQYNSLHEALVARWAEIAPALPATLHVGHVEDPAGEDAVTAAYLRDTAEAAGITTIPILMNRIGWNHDTHCFVDEVDLRIEALFKLYPWEWLVHEEFAGPLLDNLERGLTEILLARDVLLADLDANWEVLAEAIQTVVRAEITAGRSQITDPYALLKELTRGRRVGGPELVEFVQGLDIGDEAKQRLISLTPAGYTGLADRLVDEL